MPPQTAAPLKPPAMFAPKDALNKSAVLVDQIPGVVEQMRYHKKQARRLAEYASLVFDGVDEMIPKPPPDEVSAKFSEGLEKLLRWDRKSSSRNNHITD
jgi:hypothetical protein